MHPREARGCLSSRSTRERGVGRVAVIREGRGSFTCNQRETHCEPRHRSCRASTRSRKAPRRSRRLPHLEQKAVGGGGSRWKAAEVGGRPIASGWRTRCHQNLGSQSTSPSRSVAERLEARRKAGNLDVNAGPPVSSSAPHSEKLSIGCPTGYGYRLNVSLGAKSRTCFVPRIKVRVRVRGERRSSAPTSRARFVPRICARKLSIWSWSAVW